MRYWLIMPAAGSGRRFGEALPKQYAPLLGRTVIEWALAPFVADVRCVGIVVALAPDDPYWAQVGARLNTQAASAPVQREVAPVPPATVGAYAQREVAPVPPATVSAYAQREVVRAPPSTALAPNALEGPSRVSVTTGGAERSHSVLNALHALASVAAPDDWVLVHDAARPCLPSTDLDALLQKLALHPVGGLLAAPASDTLKRAADDGEIQQTVDRTSLWRALTPQMFRYHALIEALERAVVSGRTPTDEAQAIEWMGQKPVLVEGSAENIKVTHARDLVLADALLRARSNASSANEQVSTMRVGSGIDVHAFGPGDFVMLAGVRVPYTRGIVAHSDGDVILHALCDALLGAAGLGDIGQHFRDDDPQWKGADSKQFVTAVLGMLKERNMRVLNADVTVLAEAPRLASYRPEMRRTVAALLEVDESRVNIKATTTERLGFIGRSEGLAAQAVVAVSDA